MDLTEDNILEIENISDGSDSVMREGTHVVKEYGGGEGINKGTVFYAEFGCAHNVSDGEFMCGCLEGAGYGFTDSIKDSDILLINSCTVKHPSEMKCAHLIEQAKIHRKPVVVAGCVPQAGRNNDYLEGTSLLGVNHIDKVVSIVESTLKGHIMRHLGTKGDLPQLLLPKRRRNRLIDIIPVATGCLGNCTYCKTKHARGNLRSYPKRDIIERITISISEGVKEFWITGEDLGSYGKDRNESLSALLEEVVSVLPEDVMVRLGMTIPPFILEQIDAICTTLNHPRVYKFLHIPVQSGSDKVLENMRREYTVADFEELVLRLREKVPGIQISTDIICGFPTETEEDWRLTMDMVSRLQITTINISQFYARPGTPAAKMKQLRSVIRKERSRELTAHLNGSTPLTEGNFVGSIQNVWVNEISAKGQPLGHTENYYQVNFKDAEKGELLGHRVQTKITDATRWSLLGEVEA